METRETNARPGKVAPGFAGSDLKQVALLLVLLPVAMLLPERWWPHPCRAVAFITARRWFKHTRVLDSYLPEELAQRAGCSRSQFLYRQEARFLEEYVQLLREWTWGWRPRIEMLGGEGLQAALVLGHGAVLWVSGFESSDLVVKMALHRAGYDVTHLSRPTHGFSETRFGERYLNPLRRRIEDRYLGSRILLAGDATVGPLRALQRALRENGVVSITVGDLARSTVDLPLLGHRLRVSAGPAQLAAMTGASLIPVFTTRTPSGRFNVRLAPPIDVSETASPGRPGLEGALQQYATQLDAMLRSYPLQWTGWRTGSLKG